MQVVGPGELERLPARAGSLRYLAALVRDGIGPYVQNAHARARIALVDDVAVPLVTPEAVAGDTDVCSPFSHYVTYSLHELGRRRRVPRALRSGTTAAARALMRACELERVSFIGNWLWTTNPPLPLDVAQLEALTRHLVAAEPRAALVVRSVNRWVDPAGASTLEQAGFRLVRARRVYVLDPRDGRDLRRANVQRDLALLRRSPYRVVRGRTAIAPHVPRLVTLYRELYLVKHSPLNPALTERFFSLTLGEGVLDYHALVGAGGDVDAFFASFDAGDVLFAPLLGYDQRMPRDAGLYRTVVAAIMVHAREHGRRLNLSGGAERFKLLRGAMPVEEYDAVYDRHLPARRRAAWSVLAALGRRGAARPLDVP